MSTRQKTRTSDGLVHAVSDVARPQKDGTYSTTCMLPMEEMLPPDTPLTCLSCVWFVDRTEFIEMSLRDALKNRLGQPLTRGAAEVLQETLGRMKNT